MQQHAGGGKESLTDGEHDGVNDQHTDHPIVEAGAQHHSLDARPPRPVGTATGGHDRHYLAAEEGRRGKQDIGES